jgi:hypothetical protein
VYGYGVSYVISAGITALVIPFVLLARRERAPSDPIERDGPAAEDPSRAAISALPVAGTTDDVARVDDVRGTQA